MRASVYPPLLGSSYRRWILPGFMLFVVGLFLVATSPYISNDESWFLQVLNRLKNGETLYKDVFSGVTPLSFYLALFLVRALGTELLVLKAVMALIFASIGLVGLWIGNRLNLGDFFKSTFLLVLVVYCPPYIMGTSTPYTPLAYLFLMVVIAATLEYQSRRADPQRKLKTSYVWLALAAACAGLSFAAKQTTGAYTLVGMLLALLIINNGRIDMRIFWLEILFSGIVFVLVVVVLVLIPIVWSGGLSDFLDYAFLNKGTYLQVAPISYRNQLAAIIELTRQVPLGVSLEKLYFQIQYLLPFITALVVGTGFLRLGSQRGHLAVMTVFSAAAMVDVFPRVTAHHLSCAIPILWITVAYGLKQLNTGRYSPLGRATGYVVIIWLLVGLGISFLNPMQRVLRGGERLTTLPHMRGVLYPPQLASDQLRATERLKELVAEKPVFILSAEAGFLYLISDLDNPTPYDYGLVTAFGLEGEQRTIQAVLNGEIPYVCIAPFGNYYLRPVRLQEFVLSQMKPLEDLRVCTLFKAAPD